MLRLLHREMATHKAVLMAAALAVSAVGIGVRPAHAEVQIGVYGGWNQSFDSDIDLDQPGGTNLTLSDVPWDGDSFGAPPYWGVRGTYWLDNAPNWGLMVDYNHA